MSLVTLGIDINPLRDFRYSFAYLAKGEIYKKLDMHCDASGDLYHIGFVKQTYRIFRIENIDKKIT